MHQQSDRVWFSAHFMAQIDPKVPDGRRRARPTRARNQAETQLAPPFRASPPVHPRDLSDSRQRSFGCSFPLPNSDSGHTCGPPHTARRPPPKIAKRSRRVTSPGRRAPSNESQVAPDVRVPEPLLSGREASTFLG
ncbi:hypothetical protein FRACA_550025 [Frankia canadensis]|uniref:Uncharacterized protein n=1 Tax=Frankia canadensis TaxID=1836972 RepID=A0A2I2KYZ5_9ACTN|nr:hypothetical protein FRACA_550025 [Frankia canadensis]SOU58160.1 hypothetical protein FRACA_550025 [Frankia canadensis]